MKTLIMFTYCPRADWGYAKLAPLAPSARLPSSRPGSAMVNMRWFARGLVDVTTCSSTTLAPSAHAAEVMESQRPRRFIFSSVLQGGCSAAVTHCRAASTRRSASAINAHSIAERHSTPNRRRASPPAPRLPRSPPPPSGRPWPPAPRGRRRPEHWTRTRTIGLALQAARMH